MAFQDQTSLLNSSERDQIKRKVYVKGFLHLAKAKLVMGLIKTIRVT